MEEIFSNQCKGKNQSCSSMKLHIPKTYEVFQEKNSSNSYYQEAWRGMNLNLNVKGTNYAVICNLKSKLVFFFFFLKIVQ